MTNSAGILNEYFYAAKINPGLFIDWIMSYTSLPRSIVIGLVATFAVAAIVVFQRFYFSSRVVLFHRKNTVMIKYKSPVTNTVREMPLDQMVKITCPHLSDPKHNVYYPHPLLINGHLQTMYASVYGQYLQRPIVKFVRELVKTPDGGVISLDWTEEPTTKGSGVKTPYVLILHGLTGGSHETYIQDMIVKLNEYGYISVVMNFRGCANTPVLSPALYSGSFTDDVKLTVERILERDPGAVIFGAGFSLGSNVLTKYAGQLGAHCPLIGIVSVGNPYDLLSGQRALYNSFLGKNVYLTGLGSNLKSFLFKHVKAFESADWLDLVALAKATSVREFDTLATAKFHGYKTVNEYYRHGSSVVDIPYLEIPSLFLSAVDDPICHKSVIPYDEIESNPYTILATTSSGGHLGWFQSGWDNLLPRKRWMAQPVSEFIHSIIESRMSLPESEISPRPVGFSGTPWHALPKPALIQREHFFKAESSITKEDTGSGNPPKEIEESLPPPETKISSEPPPKLSIILKFMVGKLSKLSRMTVIFFIFGFILRKQYKK